MFVAICVDLHSSYFILVWWKQLGLLDLFPEQTTSYQHYVLRAFKGRPLLVIIRQHNFTSGHEYLKSYIINSCSKGKQ